MKEEWKFALHLTQSLCSVVSVKCEEFINCECAQTMFAGLACEIENR